MTRAMQHPKHGVPWVRKAESARLFRYPEALAHLCVACCATFKPDPRTGPSGLAATIRPNLRGLTND